ncbi:MAG TPA: thiamine-phosphate kinase, partial [Gemmatimonadaceae bacterium]|nr:thiamine-phosphate kinase [Gemmatimonadaceae bacterium]
ERSVERGDGGSDSSASDLRSERSVTIELREGAEFDIVRRMVARWGRLAEGIGDDAAVLANAGHGSMVVSTDFSVENVHFRRGWLDPREIGYRATAASLSDLAAMAAIPSAILLSITLPDSWRKEIDAIADGIGEAAEQASARIVGGDLSEGRDLTLVLTVIGNAERPLRRSDARVGDSVYVTGKFGGPGAALSCLLEGRGMSDEMRKRFTHPVPRIREALWLAGHGVNAAIDISDGLAADLSNIAAASGVRILLDLDHVPAVAGISSRDAAASGEEYELAVTSAQPLDTAAFEKRFGLRLTQVGRVEGGEPGVTALVRGAAVPMPHGYLHFE